jgi:hypothetical protein
LMVTTSRFFSNCIIHKIVSTPRITVSLAARGINHSSGSCCFIGSINETGSATE